MIWSNKKPLLEDGEINFFISEGWWLIGLNGDLNVLTCEDVTMGEICKFGVLSMGT